MPIPRQLAALAGPALRLQPDGRLVELAREGHDRAFDEIVRRYRGALVGFAGGIVPKHRAEDVVQESVTKAHAAIHRDDSDIAVKPWLYTIVRNAALNDLRDEPVHEPIDPDLDGVPQPPDVAARKAELGELVSGIQALPDAQRSALVMRELEGRGHHEIAGHLGVSDGAVRQLIFRARTTLRDGLGLLVPGPLLRALLEDTSVRAAGAGAGIGGTASTFGGGAGVKAGVAVLAAAAAVGGGVALRHHRHGDDGPAAAHAALVDSRAQRSARVGAPTASLASHQAEGGTASPDGGRAGHPGHHAGRHSASAVSGGPRAGGSGVGGDDRSAGQQGDDGPSHEAGDDGGQGGQGAHHSGGGESGDDGVGSRHGGGGSTSGGGGGGSGSGGSDDEGSDGDSGGEDGSAENPRPPSRPETSDGHD